MKRKPLTHAARLLCALALSMSLAPAALAADPSEPTQPSPCYPTAVTRSEDGTEIRKMYDLGPEDDPGGIPRSDFEQDGYHYCEYEDGELEEIAEEPEDEDTPPWEEDTEE